MPDSDQTPATPEMHNARSNEALELAGNLAVALGTVTALPLRPQDAERLEALDTFRFGPDASRKAWSIGTGPLVILVHGYSGLGVQMAPSAEKLAERGFQSVFFDAGGHGHSRPEKIGFSTFIEDTRHIFEHFDTNVHGLIGHSAGALAMMRARALHGVRAARYGLVSAPLFPYVPLDMMRAVGASEDALDHVKAILSDQFSMRWSELVAGACYTPDEDARLLAITDSDDKKIRVSDGDAIRVLWPGASCIKTTGYGHNRVLQAPEALEALVDFVAS